MSSHRVSLLRASHPFAFSVAVCLAISVMAVACSRTAAQGEGGGRGGRGGRGGGGGAQPVVTTKVSQKNVPVDIAAVGNVEAYVSISVRSQVTGQLQQAFFHEGDVVKKGDKLFEIDARPFQAAVAQAEGDVAKAEAAVVQAQAAVAQVQAAMVRDQVQEANARKTLARQAELLQKHVSPQADYDKALTDADALIAAVRADEAAVRASGAAVHAGEATVLANKAALVSAGLQLERCTINSPLDGIAGNILVDEGNAVLQYVPSLVTINQIHPVDVFFSVPQKDLPAVQKYSALGTLKAKVLFPQESGEVEIGDLTFIDNSVDRVSGTITLGATFENKNERLWPGQYVDVTLVLAVENDAVVVPTKAVQVGRDGKFVFIVNAERKAETRPVTVGTVSESDTVVLTGLKTGEEVVTDGQFQLTEGAKTEMKGDGAGEKGQASKGAAKGSGKKGSVDGSKKEIKP